MNERHYLQINAAATGKNIRSIMEKKGLTIKDVQKFLGLSAPQSVYHWFDGRNLPTLDNLYALSELLCTPMDALVKGNRLYSFDIRE